ISSLEIAHAAGPRDVASTLAPTVATSHFLMPDRFMLLPSSRDVRDSFRSGGHERDPERQLGRVREPAALGRVEELSVVEAQRDALAQEEAHAEADVAGDVDLALLLVEAAHGRADDARAEG